MEENGLGKHVKLLPIIIFYLGLAYYVSVQTGLHTIVYSLLAPSLVYIFYKNDLSKLKYIIIFLLLLFFVLVDFDSKTFMVFYSAMAFVCIFVVEKLGEDVFKNLITFIVIMMLVFLAVFFVSENIRGGESFIETLNNTLNDENAIAQINEMLVKEYGEQAVDFSSIDKTTLKVAISSLVAIVAFDLVGMISTINFAIIIYLMRGRNDLIPKLKPLWKMRVPGKFIALIFAINLLGTLLHSSIGDFSLGIVIIFLMLFVQLCILQGIFVVSFLLNTTKMPLKLHIPLLIFTVLILYISGVGITLLFFVGIIDSIINFRKLPRRRNEK